MRLPWVRRLTVGLAAPLALFGFAACKASGTYPLSAGISAPPGTEAPLVRSSAGVTPSTADTANAAAFCQDSQALQALLPALLQPNGGAAAVARAEAIVSRFAADAPAEIRPDARIVAQAEQRIINDLRTNPPNLSDLAGAFTDPAFQQALRQVGAYAFAHC